MAITKYFLVFLFLVGLLSGCGEDVKPKGQAAAPAGASAATAPTDDPLAPRYEASLAEGIDFKRPGYPSFLTEVSGISGLESWGRWTDGPVAKFRFKQPLPSKLTLLISAGAIDTNVGKQTIVRVGKVEKAFTVKGPEQSAYTLTFEGVDGIDTIEIVPAKPTRPYDLDPKNEDKRLLGVGINFLKIQ